MASTQIIFMAGAITVAAALGVGVVVGVELTEVHPQQKVAALAFERNTQPQARTVDAAPTPVERAPQPARAVVPDVSSAFIVVPPPASPPEGNRAGTPSLKRITVSDGGTGAVVKSVDVPAHPEKKAEPEKKANTGKRKELERRMVGRKERNQEFASRTVSDEQNDAPAYLTDRQPVQPQGLFGLFRF